MSFSEADAKTQRRDLLASLLSKFERNVIADYERPLLRPLVEAEMVQRNALDEVNAKYEQIKQAYEKMAERAKLAEETAFRIRDALPTEPVVNRGTPNEIAYAEGENDAYEVVRYALLNGRNKQ